MFRNTHLSSFGVVYKNTNAQQSMFPKPLPPADQRTGYYQLFQSSQKDGQKTTKNGNCAIGGSIAYLGESGQINAIGFPFVCDTVTATPASPSPTTGSNAPSSATRPSPTPAPSPPITTPSRRAPTPSARTIIDRGDERCGTDGTVIASSCEPWEMAEALFEWGKSYQQIMASLQTIYQKSDLIDLFAHMSSETIEISMLKRKKTTPEIVDFLLQVGESKTFIAERLAQYKSPGNIIRAFAINKVPEEEIAKLMAGFGISEEKFRQLYSSLKITQKSK
jgi:hypothetical protein